MSIQRVTLTSAEEPYSPPDGEIEIAVVGDRVLITVYKGSLENIPSNRTKVFDVPALDVEDVCAALWALIGSDRNWGRPAA